MTTSNYPTTSTGRYKRSVKNLLLDSRFQLKYTGMAVIVAIAVSAILGAFLYRTSREVVAEGQRVVEESRKVSDVVKMSIKDSYADNPELAAAFNEESSRQDRQVEDHERALVHQQQMMLFELVFGLTFLVLVIGVCGIWFTHKIAGPVYKMKMLLRQVGDGRLVFQGQLRRGDELQDFFEAFATMVTKLRDRQAGEVSQLDTAIRLAGEAGASQESLAKVKLVRDEMKRAIDS